MSAVGTEIALDPDLAHVDRLLREIAGSRPVPEVRLSDAPVSYHVRRGRRAWLEISRGALLRPVAALMGEIAHEYAHFLISKTRLDRCWTALFLVVLFLGAGVAFASIVVGLTADGGHPSLTPVFAGFALIVVDVCSWMLRSRRGEFQADSLAASLVGSASPVLAFLDCVQPIHERLPWHDRVASHATHPSPTRRKRALLRSDQRSKA